MTKIRDNGFAVALAAGLVLALVVGATYAITSSSRRLARHAEALHAAHETLQATVVARSQLELAVYQVSGPPALASDAVLAEAALDTTLRRAEAGLAAAQGAHQVLAAMGESHRAAGEALQHFTDAGTDVISDIEASAGPSTDEVELRYRAVLGELTAIRDRLAGAVAGSERTNAWIAAVGGFLAVFAIPAAVITVYYVLDRRRRRQHELEVTLQAERAAQATRERFLTAVTHQLREPLWAVRGIFRMLGNDEVLMAQPQVADLHLLLSGELDDMNGLMDNLLTASRIEAGELEYTIEPVDPREVVHTLVDSLNHRGASIYVAMDDGVVEADRRHLRQMIRNLLVNALKYGGPNIEVKGHADDDSYTIIVVDDGQGVSRSMEPQLFTRFVHDQQNNQSVGLGLSIVMALAVAMGGTAFHQRVDGLTRFGVRLPHTIAGAGAGFAGAADAPHLAPVTRAAS